MIYTWEKKTNFNTRHRWTTEMKTKKKKTEEKCRTYLVKNVQHSHLHFKVFELTNPHTCREDLKNKKWINIASPSYKVTTTKEKQGGEITRKRGAPYAIVALLLHYSLIPLKTTNNLVSIRSNYKRSTFLPTIACMEKHNWSCL